MVIISISARWTCGGLAMDAHIKCPTCDTILVRPLCQAHQTTHCKACFDNMRSLMKRTKEPLWREWQYMKTRCSSSYPVRHRNYTARGITVCAEWLTNYHAFKQWALDNGYEKGLSIERINNNAGYSPGNCCWIPQARQARNTRRCVVNEQSVLEIRALLSAGARRRDICAWFGISRQIVYQIARRKTWKGVEP